MEDVLIAAGVDDNGTGIVHLQAGPHRFRLDPASAAMFGRMLGHAAGMARRMGTQPDAEPARPEPGVRRPERLPGHAHSWKRNRVGARRLGQGL